MALALDGFEMTGRRPAAAEAKPGGNFAVRRHGSSGMDLGLDEIEDSLLGVSQSGHKLLT